jgi:hypothetical protein
LLDEQNDTKVRIAELQERRETLQLSELIELACLKPSSMTMVNFEIELKLREVT